MGTRRGKRGKWFETALENVNKMYKYKKIAIIDKIATPINFNTRTGKAFYEAKSTVDFIGCKSNGRMVSFDAKETELQRFPFDRVSQHQVDYLIDTKQMNCESFLLIYFKFNQTCFKIYIDDYIRCKRDIGRKSIPYEWFTENTIEIKSGNGVAFDYLEYDWYYENNMIICKITACISKDI